MKTRMLSLALAVSLLLGIPVLAAENSTGNFVRSRTYAGEFSDLTASLSEQLDEPILSYDLKVSYLCPNCRKQNREP